MSMNVFKLLAQGFVNIDSFLNDYWTQIRGVDTVYRLEDSDIIVIQMTFS